MISEIKLFPNAFEITEFWFTVEVEAEAFEIAELWFKQKPLLFFNMWFLSLLSERRLSLESCLAIFHPRASCLETGGQ